MADTVRRITIQGKTEGVKETTRDVKALGSAIDGVSASSEKQNRSQLSVANALDRQRRSLESSYRAQQDLEKAQRTFDRGLRQGLIGQEEHSRLMGLARDRADQVANGVGAMERAFDRFQNSITRRFIFAVLINEMRDLLVWIGRLPSALSTIGDVSQRLGINAQRYQGYEAAAGLKGVDPQQFQQAALGLSQAMYEAKFNANDLSKLFATNNLQIKDFESNWLAIAELVKRATGNFELQRAILQQSNIPATRELVKLFEQGLNPLKQTAQEYQKLAADDRLIKQAEQFDEAWKRAWTNFSVYARSAANEALAWLRQTMNQGEQGAARMIADASNPNAALLRQSIFRRALDGKQYQTLQYDPAMFATLDQQIAQSARGASAGLTRPPLDPKEEEAKLNRERQRIGVLAELGTVTDQVRAKEIELQLAMAAKVKITGEERALLLDLTRVRAEEAENAIRVANGVATAEQLRATKERELSVLVRAKKLDQDEANIALAAYNRTIQETIERQKVYTATLPNLKQLELDAGNARKGIDELTTTSLNGLSSSLSDGIMRTRTWGDAFRNFGNVALRAMSDLIVKMTIIQPLARGLQASLGGSGFLGFLGIGGTGSAGGSALGSLFHTGGIVGDPVAGRYIHPAYFDNAPRYHNGGLAGDEVPAILQRGEEVLRRDDPRHRRNGGGGGSVVVNLSVDMRAADPSMKAWTAGQMGRLKAEVLSQVTAVVAKENRDNPNLFRK